MGYIYSIQTPDNNTHLIQPLLYTTAGGTSTALTAAINNFTLVAGAYINLKVGEVGVHATLNVNNTGAQDIYYNDVQISAGMLLEDHIYTFIYDGNHWIVTGDIIRKNVSVNNHNLIFTSN